MNDTKQPILVFGATGQQGGSVARALRMMQWPVRAFVRDPAAAKAIALRDAGVELAQGTLTDTSTIRAAMADTHGVFCVLPGTLSAEEEVCIGCAIADLAIESSVSHLVYSSGASVGEKPTGVARFDAKGIIEAQLRTLPITTTIVRPVIFMEMLPNSVFGLDKGRFTFFLRPDQSMQLIAVEDIGKFVAAIFADASRFAGATLRLASDTVTGHDLEAIFTEVAGRPITYTRFSDAVLAANPDFAAMSASLDDGPLANHVGLSVMRAINPEIVSFRSWLAGDGRIALDRAIRAGGEGRQAKA